MKRYVLISLLFACFVASASTTFTWSGGGDVFPSTNLEGMQFTSTSANRISLQLREGKVPTIACNAVAIASSVSTTSDVSAKQNRVDCPIYLSLVRNNTELARSHAAVLLTPDPMWTTTGAGDGSIYQFAFNQTIAFQAGDVFKFLDAQGAETDIVFPCSTATDAVCALNRAGSEIKGYSPFVQFGTAKLSAQIVRVHPYLIRGMSGYDDAILGFRGLITSSAQPDIKIQVRFQLENCTAADFNRFRLFHQPATRSGTVSSVGTFTYEQWQFGNPGQTGSNSLSWQAPSDESSTDFTLTFSRGVNSSFNAGDSLWITAYPKETISSDASFTAEVLSVVVDGVNYSVDEVARQKGDRNYDLRYRIYPFRERIGAYTKADTTGRFTGSDAQYTLPTLTEVLSGNNGSATCHVNAEGKLYYNQNFKTSFEALKAARDQFHPEMRLKVVALINPITENARKAMTADYRDGFVESVVQVLDELGADGLDVDFEYCTTPAEMQNYAITFGKLKDRFFVKGWELSAAMSGNWCLHPSGTLAVLDYLNLMSYDGQTLNGALSTIKNHTWAVTSLPKKRVIIGQTIYGNETATWHQAGWGTIVNQSGYFADDCDACAVSDGTYQTFTGPVTYRAKVRYCLDQGYGGVMSWGYYSDTSWDHSQCLGRAQSQVIYPHREWNWQTPEQEGETYILDSEEDWHWFTENAGKVTSVKLGADITLSHDPKPIDSFAGTFDGENHTLTLPKETWIVHYDEAGLFRTVTGTIRNLTIDCYGRVISRRDRRDDAGDGKGWNVQLTSRSTEGAQAGLLAVNLAGGAKVENVKLYLREGGLIRGSHNAGVLAGGFWAPDGTSVTVKNVVADIAGKITTEAVDSLGAHFTLGNSDAGGLIGNFNHANTANTTTTLSDVEVVLRPTAVIEACDGTQLGAGGIAGHLAFFPQTFSNVNVTWYAGASVTSTTRKTFFAQPWFAHRGDANKNAAPTLADHGAIRAIGGLPWSLADLWVRETEDAAVADAVNQIKLKELQTTDESTTEAELDYTVATDLIQKMLVLPKKDVTAILIESPAVREAVHAFKGIYLKEMPSQARAEDKTLRLTADWDFKVDDFTVNNDGTVTLTSRVYDENGQPAEFEEATTVRLKVTTALNDATKPFTEVTTTLSAATPTERTFTVDAAEAATRFFKVEASR